MPVSQRLSSQHSQLTMAFVKVTRGPGLLLAQSCGSRVDAAGRSGRLSVEMRLQGRGRRVRTVSAVRFGAQNCVLVLRAP